MSELQFKDQLSIAYSRTGLYQTASEVVREGLRLLIERDQHLAALRRDIRADFQAVDQGEYADYDAAHIQQLAQRVKRRGRRWPSSGRPLANGSVKEPRQASLAI
ncbi:MAG: type II toxin-antitoxin system ParD family antitoxin [Bryobacterales bacterium]|nr:type II toxin-antitoxin system ParD family antitoxin [Bryobacterales bacterium]